MCLSAGKQRKLTAWLGSLTADPLQSQPGPSSCDITTDVLQASNIDTNASEASSLKVAQASSVSTASGKEGIAASVWQLPVSLTRKGSGARPGLSRRGARVGQTSLKSFMQRPPAATANAASASNAIMQCPSAAATVTASALVTGDSTPALAGLLGAAPAGLSATQEESDSQVQPDLDPLPGPSNTQLLHQPLQKSSQMSTLHAAQQQPLANALPAAENAQERSHAALTAEPQAQEPGHATHGTTSAALLGAGQASAMNALSDPLSLAQRVASESSDSLNADVGKAAATAAWSKIHSKMKAPKCKGHGEDCVIREVKKNGPNKGEGPLGLGLRTMHCFVVGAPMHVRNQIAPSLPQSQLCCSVRALTTSGLLFMNDTSLLFFVQISVCHCSAILCILSVHAWTCLSRELHLSAMQGGFSTSAEDQMASHHRADVTTLSGWAIAPLVVSPMQAYHHLTSA